MEIINSRIIGVLIALLCTSAVIAVCLARKKHKTVSRAIIVCTAIIIIVFAGWKLYDNKKTYIQNFAAYSIDNLQDTNNLLNLILDSQKQDVGKTLSVEDLKENILVTSFVTDFKNNNFENLQLEYVFQNNTDSWRKNIQVNYAGQLFESPKASIPENTFTQSAPIPLETLQHAISAINDSAIIRQEAFSDSEIISIKYNGYIEPSPENQLIQDAYLFEYDEVMPLSTRQEDNGYYLFFLISGAETIPVMFPLR